MYFSGYMNEWLYGEEGYYKNFKAIGKAGDFYTAVSASPFFGASIANYLWQQIEEGNIPRNAFLVEIGAHQGYLIGDMIQWLYTCDSTLMESMRFAIIERQPQVQEAQKAYLSERFGGEVTVAHYDSLEAVHAEYAFVVANEIFDAFPCELVKDGEIAVLEEDQISWERAPELLLNNIKKYRQVKGEVAVGYEAFAEEMARGIKNCDFVSFDYGEKYVRNDFSIRLYRKHETFPLFDEEVTLAEEFRKSDITYDVNFEHVIDAFEAAGFETVGYETQARALVRFGLIDMLESFARQTTQEKYLREVDKVKTLIAPTMMGDKFKMLHLRKRDR
ncbi:MAG: SAM-dependent methyltransferase [Campylobacterota bacterium]|nr:SAM-dependent methyltransferase [Campylobacterota bacterium]